MTRAIVVGGGISGLVSSLLLAQKFDDVMVIEAAPECGGLLRSITDNNGNYFDQGTHIPDLTGIDEIDHFLFGTEANRSQNWNKYDYLNTGNYLHGSWNLETQTASIAHFDDHIREHIESDILACQESKPASNLSQHLTNRFGELAVKTVLAPIFRKLYGQDIDLEQLAVEIGGGKFFMFGHERLVAFDQTKTSVLKKNPVFDEKLAFHTQQEFIDYMSKITPQTQGYLYPNGNQGIGSMIKRLITLSQKSGVKIITNETVEKMHAHGGLIQQIKLKGRPDAIDCDFIFWSIPPALALKAAGHDVKKVQVKTRCSNIFHFDFDIPANNTNSHFLWSWDDEDPILRLTLYDNFRSNLQNGHHLLTVECLSNNDDCLDITEDIVMKNLIKMGVISSQTKCNSCTIQRLKNTFQVPDLKFKKASEENYTALKSAFSNIAISGRFSGKVWLQSEVLRDCYQQIQSIG